MATTDDSATATGKAAPRTDERFTNGSRPAYWQRRKRRVFLSRFKRGL